jgi:hypothetical protein
VYNESFVYECVVWVRRADAATACLSVSVTAHVRAGRGGGQDEFEDLYPAGETDAMFITTR